MTVGAYRSTPFSAWSGWRLRVPGGPIGGQYHGFIAADSAGWPAGRDEIYRTGYDTTGLGAVDPRDPRCVELHEALQREREQIEATRRHHEQIHDFIAAHPECHEREGSETLALHGLGDTTGPWDSNWGGTALHEGETMSDHVYRGPAEMRPRPNASGGAHIVRSLQTKRSAGFAVAPGNYRGIGYMPVDNLRYPIWGANPPQWGAVNTVRPCPAWGCGAPPVRIFDGPTGVMTPAPGATNTVPQPPPYAGPGSPYTVPVWSAPPVSPTPSPTVAAGPQNFLPSSGLTLDQQSGAAGAAPATAGISEWLAASTVIPGVKNMWVAGGALAAILLMRGKR
jgi:hypothetical protein